MTDREVLGALFQEILEGASFVRLDEPPPSARLILDLDWTLTDEQADVVRGVLRDASA